VEEPKQKIIYESDIKILIKLRDCKRKHMQ